MSIKIVNVLPTDENGKLIMEWRNDKITREMSFNQEEKVWETFRDEFYKNYFKNIPLFAIIDGVKICFVSFIYRNKKEYLVMGINMCPNFRGKKLSTPIIVSAVEFIKKNYPNVNKIVAEIKEENIPSIKAFERANFIHHKTENNVRQYHFKLLNKIP